MAPSKNALSIRELVKKAEKDRVNRAYYFDCFTSIDIYKNGLIPEAEKSRFDFVELQPDKNDYIKYYGFDHKGSHFQLDLALCKLSAPGSDNLVLGSTKFELVSVDGNGGSPIKYRYDHEELVDFADKLANPSSRNALTIYKVGQVTVEIIQPFALARIFFSGPLRKEQNQVEETVFAKINISTHPTCDKFDYQYKFSAPFLETTLGRSIGDQQANKGSIESSLPPGQNGISSQAAANRTSFEQPVCQQSLEQLLKLALQDRIDLPLMFQGRIEEQSPARKEIKKSVPLLMWGAKRKSLFAAQKADALADYENLFVWTESGQVIHLTRPVGKRNLISGVVTNATDYPSYLHSADLDLLNSIDSLKSIPPESELKVVGYVSKEFNIKFDSDGRVSSVNGFKAYGFSERDSDWLLKQFERAKTKLWTLRIQDSIEQRLATEALLGGKGNSLVQLSQMVQQKVFSDRVSVPQAVVVTSKAYEFWLAANPKAGEAIEKLDRTRRALAARTFYVNPFSDTHMSVQKQQKLLKDLCEGTRTILSSCPLPDPLRDHLHNQLVLLFGDQADQISLAVRSSAVGEDSLETSAAGQMKTMLDVKGLEQVCQAVVDCWASQFELEAITYKSQNGLNLNLPMAVVVQQLIIPECAGVGATCDPLTGDFSKLELLATRGFGEAVVEGKETDTVRVSLGYDMDRKQLLDLNDSELENHIQRMQERECCIDTGKIVALSNVLIQLRQASQIKAREIEWAITGESVHLLQSRPLTNLSRMDTSEIDHENDYGFSSPHDLCSRANIGEVMPGSLAPTTISFFLSVTRHYDKQRPFVPEHTYRQYAADTFGFHVNMAVMNLSVDMTIRRFGTNDDKSKEAVETLRSMMGTEKDNLEEEGDKSLRERLNLERLNPVSRVTRNTLAQLIVYDTGLASLHLRKSIKRAPKLNMSSKNKPIELMIERLERSVGNMHSLELQLNYEVDQLWKSMLHEVKTLRHVWLDHIMKTILSMTFNVACMKFMSKQPCYPDDFNSPEIQSDFSKLMRKVGEKIVSVDVGKLLDQLAQLLADEGQLDKVKSMNIGELYTFLNSTQNSSESAKMFRKFMRVNGHRGFREFDFGTLTWSDDPSYICRSLALRLKTVPGDKSYDREKERVFEKEAEEVMAKITNKRAVFSGYLLPRARSAVVRREKSKSLLILMVDKYRKAYRHLSALMCLQGKIPHVDLLNYLTLEELDYAMFKVDHDPGFLSKLLYKARRRQQRSIVLNKINWSKPMMTFAEMIEETRGYTEPDQQTKIDGQPEAEVDATDEPNMVRGLISCAGCVTGRVLVANSINDMDQIEPNDILITNAIDISWSVYFFTLAGIVTEFGGIISHGAVVAREYGIPTLCTARNACSKFKTGQMVTLDANKGICYLAQPESELDQAKQEGTQANGQTSQ